MDTTIERLIDYLVLHQQCELRDAPCMEIYRNDPNLVAPTDCITDLAVPIV
jgi:DNA gyrase inhibitor GyrI